MSGAVAHVTRQHGYTLENLKLICEVLSLCAFNESEDDGVLGIF